MRDFIRTYGKLAGLFAAAAFVLSSMTGIVARNSVGAVVLRAALLAVLFCALGVGLQFVVKKFLPELTGAPAAPADERAPGSGINIVLPEESPLQAGLDADAAYPEAPVEAAETGERADETGPVEALEEVGEQEIAIPDEPTDASEVEEPAAFAEPDQPGRGTAKQSSSPVDLDALPDIGGLEASGPAPGRSRAPRRAGSGASAEEAMRSFAVHEDPSTLAKAIRTVLKREDKG